MSLLTQVPTEPVYVMFLTPGMPPAPPASSTAQLLTTRILSLPTLQAVRVFATYLLNGIPLAYPAKLTVQPSTSQPLLASRQMTHVLAESDTLGHPWI